MIIINNEEALRVKCDEVLPHEVGELIDRLETELNLSNKFGISGIGLAAPQIGINKKIAIVRMGDDLNINLVNCKIIQKFDPAIFKNEGCLSFPGRVENTNRFQEIHISNNLDNCSNFIATGLFAVACQHEIDHFNETLFMDHKIPSITKSKSRPNDICICGSNKKYKKCCGKK